ncbi:hypothetical protein SD939_10600 [Lactobacillus crispatus]|uniref:hypothetical protein n=1 Tax=Lactobacillus crispatus TaxID=47770 RepID=UPI0029C4900B|nr:hypothetical protein [Lactobacillus crispatus]MDX5091652.1 hypothetical protein [Lactobacillus crispatus]
MLAVFGSALILIALVSNVPTASLLCLLAAAMFLVTREFLSKQQASKVLLFLAVFSAVVLPLFNFWQEVSLLTLNSAALLASTGLILVAVGIRPFITKRSGVSQA